MKIEYFFCDAEAGTIEFYLSKREIGVDIEEAVLSVDYTRDDAKNTELIFSAGIMSSEGFEIFREETFLIKADVQKVIIEYVKSLWENKDFRKEVRQILVKMVHEQFLIFKEEEKAMLTYYPTEKDIGRKDVKLFCEYEINEDDSLVVDWFISVPEDKTKYFIVTMEYETFRDMNLWLRNEMFIDGVIKQKLSSI